MWEEREEEVTEELAQEEREEELNGWRGLQWDYEGNYREKSVEAKTLSGRSQSIG